MTTTTPSQGCLQCAEQVQQASADTVKDLPNAVTAAVDQAQYATSLSECLEVYRALKAGQFLRAAQNYGSLFARLSVIEASLFQQAHAAAAARSSALIDSIASHARATGPVAPLVSPLAFFSGAQAAMAKLTQQWMLSIVTPSATRA